MKSTREDRNQNFLAKITKWKSFMTIAKKLEGGKETLVQNKKREYRLQRVVFGLL